MLPFLLLAACLLPAQDAPTTRLMNDINWMEFREFVPSRIDTVLLPTGTMEAHGVANNGADNTAPEALARAMAPKLNALVAPVLPYGMTGSLDGYPGTFAIREAAYRPFVADVLTGLARNGFRNILIINGHGGGQTAVLNDLAGTASREHRVRILVTNWWAICSEVTLKTFGEDGGHAGWNETAFIQAIDRKLVQPGRYQASQATPRAATGTWAAFPFPSSIILYQPGQGYPRFDQSKADAYFAAVVERMTTLAREVIAKWEEAKLYR